VRTKKNYISMLALQKLTSREYECLGQEWENIFPSRANILLMKYMKGRVVELEEVELFFTSN
jgi:hypothetical protein